MAFEISEGTLTRVDFGHLFVIVEIAGCLMSLIIHFIQRRLFFQAAIHPVWTARIVATTPGCHTSQFFFTGQRDVGIPSVVWIRHRHRIDQQLYVRMLWTVDNPNSLPAFSNRTLVKEVDLIANLIGGT